MAKSLLQDPIPAGGWEVQVEDPDHVAFHHCKSDPVQARWTPFSHGNGGTFRCLECGQEISVTWPPRL